jgi:hypothetical protein
MKKITILADTQDSELLAMIAENQDLQLTFFKYDAQHIFVVSDHILKFKMMEGLKDLLFRFKKVTFVLSIAEFQVYQFEDSRDADSCLAEIADQMDYEIESICRQIKNINSNHFLLVRDSENFSNELLNNFIQSL